MMETIDTVRSKSVRVIARVQCACSDAGNSSCDVERAACRGNKERFRTPKQAVAR